MKTMIIKKGKAWLLAAAILVTAIFVGNVPAQAASGTVNLMHKVSTATANSPIRYNFTLTKKSDISFVMKTNERIGSTITIKDPDHDTPLQTVYLSTVSQNMQYISSKGIYKNSAKINLPEGNYVLELSFENDVNFDFTMDQVSSGARLNTTALSVTKGFTGQIKVLNGGTMKSCTSSNNSIASVTNKGVVTGKKNGKTTLKVKLTNGKTLACKVSVVSNTYAGKKIAISDVPYNTCEMKAYHAAFDGKGNIVVKFVIANNNYGTISNVSGFRITVKNAKKATVGTYSTGTYKVSVPSYSEKTCTVTIPKAKVKGNRKKIDLRTSTISISGKNANESL